MIEFCEYTEEFLLLSWNWLNDKEIKSMTMTPNFTKNDQITFFNNLKNRNDDLIYGIKLNNEKIGACGLKNVKNGHAEYWGYIGEKKYWGKGYGQIIINEIIKRAISKKICHIHLKVNKENQRAIKLYEKFDFIKKEFEENYFIMEKDIC